MTNSELKQVISLGATTAAEVSHINGRATKVFLAKQKVKANKVVTKHKEDILEGIRILISLGFRESLACEALALRYQDEAQTDVATLTDAIKELI